MHTAAPTPRTSCAPLLGAYREVRAQSERLVAPLSAEDCQLQSMPDASPSKWHLAHTTWFFETFVLERFESAFRPFDAGYRVLFNSYYQGVGPQHPRAHRGLLSRPGLDEVSAYRRQVDARMHSLLEQRCDDGELRGMLQLGLNHEQQHQELLLTDIKHALSCNPSWPAYAAPQHDAGVPTQALRWLGVPGGLVDIGHDATLDGAFHFDNEGPRHRVCLPDFELASRPVSHGDFQAFIDDDGYRRHELWLSMGWDWVRAGARRAPLYWHADAASCFTMHGRRGIERDAPLPHLSYFEADAYARWVGARLPTEAEWEHAARHFGLHASEGHFADRGRLHPASAEGADDARPMQLFGDVWEWTQSSYAAYPGYRPARGAVGEYNGKFMCNQFVLRGGSCVTPAGHVRASYRNFFPPESQWQFSGLRLARER
ncbi:MAG TPA: ergothioneine biosynthesis protein EgtB [Rubrivivax sp.]|nr:ergothioneine biosynthesis protein EgtB [Rubrivivax sp.]